MQRYAPGGEGGISHGLTDRFLFLQNVLSEPHGSVCGGDSGSPVVLDATDQLVAVHAGGTGLGPGGVIDGRLTPSTTGWTQPSPWTGSTASCDGSKGGVGLEDLDVTGCGREFWKGRELIAIDLCHTAQAADG